MGVVAELELKREMADLGEKEGYMEDEETAGVQGWDEVVRGELKRTVMIPLEGEIGKVELDG